MALHVTLFYQFGFVVDKLACLKNDDSAIIRVRDYIQLLDLNWKNSVREIRSGLDLNAQSSKLHDHQFKVEQVWILQFIRKYMHNYTHI